MTSSTRAHRDRSTSRSQHSGGGTSVAAVGLHYGGTDRSMPLVDLAQAAEQRGFDSLFLPEHSHIPSAGLTPFPGGGEVPERYFRLWDPLVGLAYVAAHTGLVIGTCVALPGGHDPISYAKAIATLDSMSGGRFVMGVGFGWNNEEFEDHGFDAPSKYSVVTEKIALMRQLWTEDEASFDGEHVRLSPSRVWPKPAQGPHPPILLGARASRINFRRIAEWGDGWIPMGNDTVETLADQLPQLHAAWGDAGRDRADLQVTVLQKMRPGIGDVVEKLGEMGVQRVLIDIPTADESTILPLLDEVAAATRLQPLQSH
ncbi:UNVERIFIED_CONTAM: putative F420-dependent oxidoreductase [Williamsia faeni]